MTAPDPLSVLIVEDEVLLAVELGYLVREVGCTEVGHAASSDEAIRLAHDLGPDLALVDVHLLDGPTGIDAARSISTDCGGLVLFMTANVKRLPEDFAGACGVIGKPYSEAAVKRALCFLQTCVREGHAPGAPPVGLTLAPAFETRWRADMARAS